MLKIKPLIEKDKRQKKRETRKKKSGEFRFPGTGI